MLLALDEVQNLYDTDKSGSACFWESVKDLLTNTSSYNVHVILAAACGADPELMASGLIELPSAMPDCVEGLIPIISTHPSLPGGLSLQLSQEEFQELWDAWVLCACLPRLQHVVKNGIAGMCGLQVGAGA